MIVNHIGLRMEGTLEDGEVSLTGGITQNNVPILDENYVAKMNANNGFSEKRMFRKIASVPIAVQLKAIQDGWDLDNQKEIYKFLNADKDLRTVEHILTPRDHHIIMK
jgi:hypothetical protein